MVAQAGYRLVNLDVTVVAARPRLAERVWEMRTALAEALDVETGRVSVKATTTDGLGALGRGEGIAAMAAVLLEPAE
jgi:2-C-methyl-D-erythritol 2,4-cyclodiphosphate synthase